MRTTGYAYVRTLVSGHNENFDNFLSKEFRAKFVKNVPLVKEAIKQRSTRYHNEIEGHVNVLIQLLLEQHNARRLKRNWPADLREG
jgi:ribosomal protein S17E